MAAPIYSLTTERMYARLPEFIRLADIRHDYFLKTYLSAFGDQMGRIDQIIARLDYMSVSDGGPVGGTSDLVDPDTADEAWLSWLAQLVGVTIPAGLNLQEKRDAVRFASSGWKAGTKRAVADAAKSELTGTRHAEVYDHSTVGSIGTGSEWDVLIVTRGTETPSGAAVVAAVTRKRAKPAGVVLHHRAYTASWEMSFRDSAGSTPGKYASWGALEADNGTWVKIEEAGL